MAKKRKKSNKNDEILAAKRTHIEKDAETVYFISVSLFERNVW